MGDLIGLFFWHFIADFVLQPREMAKNKSKHFGYLMAHCLIYSATFWVYLDIKLIGIMFSSHLVIDFISSRVTARLWKEKDIHGFFTIIGLDQFLHTMVIVYVWYFIFK